MKKMNWDKLSIFYDKVKDRYGAKVAIEEGEPRKNVYGDTPEEVEEKVKELIYKSGNIEYMKEKGIPLINLLEYYFSKRDAAGLIGGAQYSRTQDVFKQIRKYDIAYKNVKELKENDYQKFFNELAKGYTQSSFEKVYSEINQSLDFAKRKEIITEFPLDKRLKPKCKKQTKKIKALRIDQQKELTKCLENTTVNEYAFRNAVLIQMYMGLRIGEVNALRIEEIDLKNKTIYIHRTVTKDRNNKIIIEEKPKTEAGVRTLTIPDNILPYVKEQMAIALNHKDNLLFLNRNNNFVSETNANSQLKIRLVNWGLYEKDIATHALRHTYATRCIEAGIDAVVLSKLLGHSDVSVTLRTYVDVFKEFQAKNTQKTDEYYNELDLFSKKVKVKDKEQKITKNKKVCSNIIQFPKKYVANDYER